MISAQENWSGDVISDRNNPSVLTYRLLSLWIGHLDRCMASFCDRGYLRQFASQCEAALAVVARFDRCIGEVTDGAPCYADLLYYYGIPTTYIRYYHKIIKLSYNTDVAPCYAMPQYLLCRPALPFSTALERWLMEHPAMQTCSTTMEYPLIISDIIIRLWNCHIILI